MIRLTFFMNKQENITCNCLLYLDRRTDRKADPISCLNMSTISVLVYPIPDANMASFLDLYFYVHV